MMPPSFLTDLADLVLGKLGYAIEIAILVITLGGLPMLLVNVTLVGGIVLLHRSVKHGEAATYARAPDQSM